MKKFFIFIIITSILVGCKQEKTEEQVDFTLMESVATDFYGHGLVKVMYLRMTSEEICTYKIKACEELKREKNTEGLHYALDILYETMDHLLATDDNTTYDFCSITYQTNKVSQYGYPAIDTVYVIYKNANDESSAIGFTDKEFVKGDNDYSDIHPISMDSFSLRCMVADCNRNDCKLEMYI